MENETLFENIALFDEDFNYRENMYLGVSGGKIDWLSDKAPQKPYAAAKSGQNRLACPAFYNIHTHLPMVLLSGYAENMVLDDWLKKKVFPFEAEMTGDDIYYAALLAQAQLLRFGCVSSTEMYYALPRLFEANRQSCMKMNACNAIVCFDNENFESFNEVREYRDCLASPEIASSARFKVDMGVHAEYTSNPRVVEKAVEMAKEYGLNMHLHLSETKPEHQQGKARRGMTPAAYFEKHGAFDVPCTAAHCVWLEEDDFKILASRNVSVANNPVSNLKLASGFADVKKMLEHGINVGLGTDGAASNNNLNLFEELKLFATLNKALSGDPALITPTRALRAATRNGALSQGRQSSGLLKEGFDADLFLLDLSGPHLCPRHDMAASLVYAAQGSDVVLTMCDGEILYENGEYFTIDVEKVKAEAKERAKRIKLRVES